ncbi:MAG: ThiF family adenylyltransferase [bacterium]
MAGNLEPQPLPQANEVELLTRDQFYRQLTISAEQFVPPELQEKLRTANILIAGAGSIGNPIAMTAIRSGAENITVADPDSVEESNLARQEYQFYQTGKNKAQMTALNMRLVNPHASKTITSEKEGITLENAEEYVRKADVVIDAVDIRALDVIWELHKQAAEQKKPVVVGYDLAGTAMLAVYRYDKEDMKPLAGDLTEEKIAEFRHVKELHQQGSIDEASFLDYVYESFTGPINPLDVPVEQFQEIIDRKEGDTRTYQIGTTSRALSALAVETVRRILNGEEVKKVIAVDLPTEVRKQNPNVIRKLSLMFRALGSIQARGKRVHQTLDILNN